MGEEEPFYDDNYEEVPAPHQQQSRLPPRGSVVRAQPKTAAGKAAQVALNQSQSKRFANRVLRSLTDMGMPASRVSLAATTSPGASTSEVHVYLR